MFYKVQGSFIESYPNMILKEKTPQKGLSFNFGTLFPAPDGRILDDRRAGGYMQYSQRQGGQHRQDQHQKMDDRHAPEYGNGQAGSRSQLCHALCFYQANFPKGHNPTEENAF